MAFIVYMQLKCLKLKARMTNRQNENNQEKQGLPVAYDYVSMHVFN